MLSFCVSLHYVQILTVYALFFWLQTGVVFDSAPIGKSFGDVISDVGSSTYHAGDTVAVQFVGANPRVS